MICFIAVNFVICYKNQMFTRINLVLAVDYFLRFTLDLFQSRLLFAIIK